MDSLVKLAGQLAPGYLHVSWGSNAGPHVSRQALYHLFGSVSGFRIDFFFFAFDGTSEERWLRGQFVRDVHRANMSGFLDSDGSECVLRGSRTRSSPLQPWELGSDVTTPFPEQCKHEVGAGLEKPSR